MHLNQHRVNVQLVHVSNLRFEFKEGRVMHLVIEYDKCLHVKLTVSQYHFIPKQSSLVLKHGKEMSSIKKL